MPADGLSAVTWPDIWGGILALAFLGGLVLVGWKFIHPIMKRLVRVGDVILGRPAEQGIPAIPGVIERLDAQDEVLLAQDAAAKQIAANLAKVQIAHEESTREIAATLATVQAEVTPNHGTSAHDAITKRVDRVEAKVDSILAHLSIPLD